MTRSVGLQLAVLLCFSSLFAYWASGLDRDMSVGILASPSANSAPRKECIADWDMSVEITGSDRWAYLLRWDESIHSYRYLLRRFHRVAEEFRGTCERDEGERQLEEMRAVCQLCEGPSGEYNPANYPARSGASSECTGLFYALSIVERTSRKRTWVYREFYSNARSVKPRTALVHSSVGLMLKEHGFDPTAK